MIVNLNERPCFQAMEKALKAVLFFRDTKSSCLKENMHNLVIIASAVGDDCLTDLARRLEVNIGNHMRMRYPSLLVYRTIPADMYNADDASFACDVTARAVDRVKTLLGVSTFVFTMDTVFCFLFCFS